MKKVSLIIALAFSLIVTGCKKEELTPLESATKALTGKWTLAGEESVTVDGSDITSSYSGFSITFSSENNLNVFTVKNGGYAFPVNFDQWNFTDDTFSSIIRSHDLVELHIVSLTDNQLILSFSMPDPANARIRGLFGQFEFILKR